MKKFEWTLGFFGFLGFLGTPAITKGEWQESLWFLFFIWFSYFIPKKKQNE